MYLHYRKQVGMWAWLLHRITGVGVLLFLFLHILDTMMVGFGPGVYETFINLYRSAFVKVLEVLLVASVLYHALNGVRITIIDLWEGATRVQQQLFYGATVIFIVVFLPAAYFMLKPLF